MWRVVAQVRSMDQHEDSVYGVAWSPADAWIYCSLSYDGRYVSYQLLMSHSRCVQSPELIVLLTCLNNIG